MFRAVRGLSKRSTKVLNYAIFQYRLLSSARSRKLPQLIKAVQGSSKDQVFANKQQLDHRYGEDSWFVCSTPKAEVMGVADGVGGWRNIGIDAGAFAKELMYWCSSNAEQAEFDGKNPRQLLIDSYNKLKLESSNVWGSSTACLVALHRHDCTLHSANLGDSGFLVLRNGRVVHRSDEQVHSFNTPYQLTVPPNEKMFSVHCDQPELAVATHMPLQQGDLVLVATDGLFDNVPESVLVRLMSRLHGEKRVEQLQQAANRMVEMAKHLSIDVNYQSPFSLKAKANDVNYGFGGKPDDITLILASVEIPEKE